MKRLVTDSINGAVFDRIDDPWPQRLPDQQGFMPLSSRMHALRCIPRIPHGD